MVKCCFCGKLIEERFSNNPYPVTSEAEKGAIYSKERCCSSCSDIYVMPVRRKYRYDRTKYLEAVKKIRLQYQN